MAIDNNESFNKRLYIISLALDIAETIISLHSEEPIRFLPYMKN
jgi:hypothetical protein